MTARVFFTCLLHASSRCTITYKVDLQRVLAGSHLDGERLGLEVSLPLVEPLVCVEDGNTPGSKVRRLIYTEKVRRLIYKGQVRRPIYKGQVRRLIYKVQARRLIYKGQVRRLNYKGQVRRLIYKGQVRKLIYKGKPLISLTEDQLPTGLYFAHVTEVAPIHHIDTTFIGVHILNWVYGHPDRIQ